MIMRPEIKVNGGTNWPVNFGASLPTKNEQALGKLKRFKRIALRCEKAHLHNAVHGLQRFFDQGFPAHLIVRQFVVGNGTRQLVAQAPSQIFKDGRLARPAAADFCMMLPI